ncbi:MAG: hypothetical protein ABIQ35_07520, partial [Verrucomicrobiota bacterium]
LNGLTKAKSSFTAECRKSKFLSIWHGSLLDGSFERCEQSVGLGSSQEPAQLIRSYLRWEN